MKKILILTFSALLFFNCTETSPDTDNDSNPGTDTEVTNEQILNSASEKVTFDLIKGNNSNQNSITENLVLPDTIDDNVDVTWESDTPAYLTDSGQITRVPDDDNAVTLKATLSYQGDNIEKNFDLRIKGYTEIEVIEYDLAALTFDEFRGNNTLADEISTDLNLPVTGYKGSSIAWSSDNTSVCTNIGSIIKPENSNEDIQLTATLTYGNETRTKTFNLTIPGYVNLVITYTEMFPGPNNLLCQIYDEGLTDSYKPFNDMVTAQVGYSPIVPDSFPDMGTNMIWAEAEFDMTGAGNTNNNWQFNYEYNLASGENRYIVFRFSGDGGETWTYTSTDHILSDNNYNTTYIQHVSN